MRLQLPGIPERSTPHTEEGGQGHTDNAIDSGSLGSRSALYPHGAVVPPLQSLVRIQTAVRWRSTTILRFFSPSLKAARSVQRRALSKAHYTVWPALQIGRAAEIKAGAARGVASRKAPLGADSAADVRQEFQKHSRTKTRCAGTDGSDSLKTDRHCGSNPEPPATRPRLQEKQTRLSPLSSCSVSCYPHTTGADRPSSAVPMEIASTKLAHVCFTCQTDIFILPMSA